MTEIKRTKDSPGVESYYKALQKILDLQRGVLTGVLTQNAERGRNDEERLRQFLRQVLPTRFGIGTGFIVSANPNSQPSGQTDIIISDVHYNSPIHRELLAEVYPIEIAVASIEVKGSLSNSADEHGNTGLDRTLENIAKIRAMAPDKRYVEYRSEPKDPTKPLETVVKRYIIKSTLPPRSYVFAYHTDAWQDLGAFRDALRRYLLKHKDAYLHGVVVLDKDWFLRQKPYTHDDRQVFASQGNCLLKFINALLHDIQSMPMREMNIDAYHHPKKFEPEVHDVEEEEGKVENNHSASTAHDTKVELESPSSSVAEAEVAPPPASAIPDSFEELSSSGP